MFRITLLFFLIGVSFLFSQTVESADYCGNCHARNYGEWSQARHSASSAKNNPFVAAMLQWADKDTDGKAVENCLRCHEPVRALDVPQETIDQHAHEGVTCDVCHATKLQGGKTFALKLMPGNVKYGPFGDGIASEHETEFSEHIVSSNQCLTCHGNETNQNNIAFCTTQMEYENSSYARAGVTCQDCHMPQVEGKAAELGKIRQVASHQFYGGYHPDFLRDCASVTVDADTSNGRTLITVNVTNETVGHALPTGSPMRSVYLELEAFDSENTSIWKNFTANPLVDDPQAVFMRLLEDADGNAPVPPWQAVNVRFDQRLRPNETRELKYELDTANVAAVVATVKYRLAPPLLLQKLNITDEIYTEAKVITETRTDLVVDQR